MLCVMHVMKHVHDFVSTRHTPWIILFGLRNPCWCVDGRTLRICQVEKSMASCHKSFVSKMGSSGAASPWLLLVMFRCRQLGSQERTRAGCCLILSSHQPRNVGNAHWKKKKKSGSNGPLPLNYLSDFPFRAFFRDAAGT